NLGIITPAFEGMRNSSLVDDYIFIGAFAFIISALASIPIKNQQAYFSALLLAAELVFSIFAGKVFKLSVIFLLAALIFSALSRFWKGQNSSNAFKSKVWVLLLAFAVGILSFVPLDFKALVIKEKDVLPHGEFSQSPINREGKDCLEVVMDKPESYYLRGFVGEKYTSQGWQSIENKEKYESAALFYWLHKGNFYGQTQIAALADLIDSQQKNRIIIKNLGVSDKYIYAPYETMAEDNTYVKANKIGDEGLYGTKKSYRFYAGENHIRDYTSLAQSLSENESNEKFDSYLKCEAHYNEYVYNNYLQITDEQRKTLKNLLGEYNSETHMDYANAKAKILRFLTFNMSYTDNKMELSDNDFVCDFLQKSHEGNSQHFASAATVMFRYFGIPARYVEGYLITPDDVKNAQPNTPITLDDSHAHIWTEFYQDGVGWIPFEVSPPYLNIMEQADDVTGIPSAQGSENEQPQNNNKNANFQQEKEQMQNQNYKIFYVVGCLLIMVGLALLCMLVILILKRKMRLKRVKKSFENKDLHIAVINMFAYSAGLLQHFKILNSTNEIYDGRKILSEKFGREYSELYIKALELYNRVKFGYNENVSDEETRTMMAFAEKTTELIADNRKPVQRLMDRHFRFLY
ncbi:MAG: transglutaminase family protein, partial [Oscillospiraceae bacterium]